jgi:hypothetical protein
MKRSNTTSNLIRSENDENDKNTVNINLQNLEQNGELNNIYKMRNDLPLATFIITGNYKKNKFLNNILSLYNSDLETSHSFNFEIPIQYYFEYSENNSYYIIINNEKTFIFEKYDDLVLYLKLNELNKNIKNIVIFIKLKTQFYFRFSIVNYPFNTQKDKKNIFSIINKFENNLFVKTIICKSNYTQEDDIFDLKICHQSDYYYLGILKYFNNYYIICMEEIKRFLTKTKGK